MKLLVFLEDVIIWVVRILRLKEMRYFNGRSTGCSCNFIINFSQKLQNHRFLVHLVIYTILFLYTLKTSKNIVLFSSAYVFLFWVFSWFWMNEFHTAQT